MEYTAQQNSQFLDDDDLMQNTRVLSKTVEGRLRAPRTMCWKLHPTEPYRHLLDCGHMVLTDSTEPCGPNCRSNSTMKHPAPGASLVCQICIDGTHKAVFMPRKLAFRPLMSVNTAPRTQVYGENEGRVSTEDNEDIKGRVSFDPDLYLEEPPVQKLKAKKTPEEVALEKEEPHHLLNDTLEDEEDEEREKGEVHCLCEVALDSDMLPCSHCAAYFHPRCLGYRLTSRQFSIFENNQKPFYCLNCKGDRVEANYRVVEDKKTMKKSGKTSKSAKPAQKPKKKTVASAAKPTGVRKTRANTKANKNLNYVIMDDDTMVSVRSSQRKAKTDRRTTITAKISKDQGDGGGKKAAPKGPPKNRYALTANKHDK